MHKVLMAALLAAACTGAGYATANSIEDVSVVVAGTNDEWTPTGLKVEKGDVILVSARGQVVLGPFAGRIDAEGPSRVAGSLGALELKIGVDAPLWVDSHSYIVAPDSGSIKLRIHDSNYADNSGSFQVLVVRIPPSAIPPAKPAPTE
jgi:hypothetical protein